MDKKTDIVTPNADFIKFIKEAKSNPDVKSDFTKRDEDFALMAELEGWKSFKEMANERIERLRGLIDYDAAGKNLEEVGFRFMVADLASYEIERLIRRVDQVRDLYEQEQKEED